MPEKKKQKTYSGEFKIEVVETMRKENLSYKETVRHFGLRSDKQVRMWERIYLEEGKEALLLERWTSLCSQRNTERAKAEIRQAGRRRSHCRESTASYGD